MDHLALTPYPFPDGVAIPRLMPFQEYPWNGDGYLAAEVLRLKEKHGLTCALETGTCLGSTALWLGEHFGVTTCEIHRPTFDISDARFDGNANIYNLWINSTEAISEFGNHSDCLFFLDAHWGDHCPLLDELDQIAMHEVKPCIIIHDFQVPATDFGFDKMPDGRPFNLDLIHTHLDAIYGEGGWKHNYPTKVEGARRGWISVEPICVPASQD